MVISRFVSHESSQFPALNAVVRSLLLDTTFNTLPKFKPLISPPTPPFKLIVDVVVNGVAASAFKKKAMGETVNQNGEPAKNGEAGRHDHRDRSPPFICGTGVWFSLGRQMV